MRTQIITQLMATTFGDLCAASPAMQITTAPNTPRQVVADLGVAHPAAARIIAQAIATHDQRRTPVPRSALAA